MNLAGLRSCFEIIEKLFDVKFLHLPPEFSGQIGTAIFPEFIAELILKLMLVKALHHGWNVKSQ